MAYELLINIQYVRITITDLENTHLLYFSYWVQLIMLDSLFGRSLTYPLVSFNTRNTL